MFEWIKELMEATGCDWDTAAREMERYNRRSFFYEKEGVQ